jgi:magnesium-transporting ATPase (P-type)
MNMNIKKVTILPLKTVVRYIFNIIKKFATIAILSNLYLVLFLISIVTVLYLDGIPIAQHQVPHLPWQLSYSSLFNYASIILAWSFSVYESLLASDFEQGKSELIVAKEIVIALVLGTLSFLTAYLNWDNYSINAYFTIILMEFLVVQTAVSRMIIMTRSHVRKRETERNQTQYNRKEVQDMLKGIVEERKRLERLKQQM